MPIVNGPYVQAALADPPVKQLLLDGMSARNGVTATAGGGQANAVPIADQVTRVTTVATAADSVRLPQAIPGTQPIFVSNAGANSMNVFPAVGDAINALAANAAFAVANGVTRVFVCAVAGTWNTV